MAVVIPAFDLKAQYLELKEELLPVLEQVLERSEFILGENVQRLEQEVAAYTGTAYGVGVANGSDALNLALMALGIGAGDEVIVPSFTFFATAGAVARAGATPVFVDVDPETFNIDAAKIEEAVTPRTRAIIPVHLFGQAAPMEEIMRIAERHSLRVIEDAAQAIGARRNDKLVCSFGDAACLSFYPTKNLGAYGDGGMVLTSDDSIAEKVRQLRVHGSRQKYLHEEPGYNSRLDEIQAAILRVKLRHLSDWTTKRQGIAQRYNSLLAGTGLADQVIPPEVAPLNSHVFHQYTVQVERRNELARFLSSRGVGTTVYYPVPLHLQPVFRDLGYREGQLPVSERLTRTVVSLPIFPELSTAMQESVVSAIAEFYGGGEAR